MLSWSHRITAHAGTALGTSGKITFGKKNFEATLTLSHLGVRIRPPPPPCETFLNTCKTAQDITVKFFKFNFTLMEVIFHIITVVISLRCCHGNLLLWMCRVTGKWRILHINLTGYLLDLARIWCRGVFLDSKSKINKNKLYDVIVTSKWREG